MSGGEPLLQADFYMELLRLLKKRMFIPPWIPAALQEELDKYRQYRYFPVRHQVL